MEEMIVSAATQAVRRARPVEVGLSRADGAGIGPIAETRWTCRPGNSGVNGLFPSRPDIPCLHGSLLDAPHSLARDSTLISADFPGMTRKYLQREVLGPDCPVLYHTGPAGNQSLRHSVTGNTFPEAERVGRLLGEAIAKAISRIHYITPVNLFCCQEFVDPPPRSFAPVEQAQAALESAKARLKQLRAPGSPQQIRTAEVDWFGRNRR